MLVCVLGTLFNLANILVLTHRDMRNPVNMILTGIAVADFLNNLEYIPFTVHMNIYDIEGRHPEEKVKERKILDHTKENTPTHSSLVKPATKYIFPFYLSICSRPACPNKLLLQHTN